MKTGVSVFTGLKEYTLEKTLEYLKIAHTHNVEMVFSSAHITEADRSIDELNQIIEKCYEYNMKFVIDVSKAAFTNLGLSDKVYAYRLDYGFTDEEIIEMSRSNNYFIELNASTLSEEKLCKLIDNGLNVSHVRASFNYYPKLYTGHDIIDAKRIIKMFNKYGINVGAFLPSFHEKRPPMYEGLPSIESHRNLSHDISIEELKAIGASEIFFGDSYASLDEIIKLEKHSSDVVTLFANLNDDFKDNETIKEILLSAKAIRPDVNSYLLRISGKRGFEINPCNNNINRKVFDLTIDNALYGRYSGEVNIVISEIPSDKRVNVIGNVNCSKLIADYIKEHKQVKFIFD